MSIGLVGFVLLTAIIVLFSDNFAQLIKKIFALWGMKLFLPLLIASTVFIDFFRNIEWLFQTLLRLYRDGMLFLAAELKWGSLGRPFIGLLGIWLMTLLPSFCIMILLKLRDRPPAAYHGRVMMMAWMVASCWYVAVRSLQ
ncbi:MAG: hypothetical protein JJT82_03780 [Legionellaceae bacterium]|nr:hypothetical protein [Legionellaceae bacterium]